MSDRQKPKAPSLISGSDAAPVIYLDGAIAWGEIGGVIQVETAMNHLLPNDQDGVKTKVVVTAHLRCSLGAARNLRDALDKAIAMAIPPDKRN